MSRQVYLYDHPADVPKFFPFTQSRPIGELRHGAWLLRERWEEEWGVRVAGHISAPHLETFIDAAAPPVVHRPPDNGARWFFRSTMVPSHGITLDGIDKSMEPVRLVCDDGTEAGCFLPSGERWPGAPLPDAWASAPAPCRLIAGVWQLIGDLGSALRADLAALAAAREPGPLPAGCNVLGDPGDIYIDEGATIEPLVVFDTRNGPIWIQQAAEVRTFSRLAGPLVVGRGSRIVGGQLRESSIGPKCIVHGEVSSSLFLGYANKSHDGFLGHAIVGRWVNLGAGTINSNLKNTYGDIRLRLGAETVETGMQFLGALLGDHVKTAIGTMLPTGCVVGTGANLFGTRRPESSVPAFAWGTDEPGRLLACRMFLQTAAKVLPRRDVAFDDQTKRYLESVWTHATGQPCG